MEKLASELDPNKLRFYRETVNRLCRQGLRELFWRSVCVVRLCKLVNKGTPTANPESKSRPSDPKVFSSFSAGLNEFMD